MVYFDTAGIRDCTILATNSRANAPLCTKCVVSVIILHAYEPFSAELIGRVRLTSNINALQLAFARCAKNGLPNNTHDIHRVKDSR